MTKALVSILLSCAASAAGAQQMDPGEWKFDSTLTSPLFDKPQVHSMTRCITPEQANPQALMGGQPKTDCKVTTNKGAGGSVSWEMVCPKDGTKAVGSGKASGGSMEGTLRISEIKGDKLVMQTVTTGKRLGACKK
jgi:hypothetical protein